VGLEGEGERRNGGTANGEGARTAGFRGCHIKGGRALLPALPLPAIYIYIYIYIDKRVFRGRGRGGGRKRVKKERERKKRKIARLIDILIPLGSPPLGQGNPLDPPAKFNLS
jgi:hypothetical protein